MLACASEEQLAGFVLGTCGPDESRSIAVHLKRCVSCRRWVDEARSDDDLLKSVQRVLSDDADDASPRAAETRSSAPPSWSTVPRSNAEPVIEGYQVQRELGRGGMGVVYLALQQSTKRKVALKVLLEGPFASPAAKRRFEREVELAALLDHPSIVSVLESGVASGRYYFAMRYVEGRRLDEWIAGDGLRAVSREAARSTGADQPANRKPPSALEVLLTLFARVCEAVSYAHRRGVIHRDLKPSNIVIDDAGNPYILDFGLAKPADAAPSEEDVTKLSVTGHVMGTLAYMSPEQSTGAHRNVDVRSDVYSLGVIFYQILTGQFPYPVTGRVAEILEHIAETSPRRPSTLVSHVNDEVETIVLKSLAKDPARRYQSADALAADVRRYLAGQPIEAKRDSGWYMTRKLLSRYRIPVSVALVFAVLLGITSYVVLSGQARWNRWAVRDMLAKFVVSPNHALLGRAALSPAVTALLTETVADYTKSSAYTDRVAAGRSGPWVNPDAFWNSVDGHELWIGGEWLEVCEVDWIERQALIDQALEKAANGSNYQKYVAFCILGEMAEGQGSPALFDACERATNSSLSSGVVAAAHWAAMRWGREIPWASRERIFVDDHSGLVFAQVPYTQSYRRGSGPDDPDRLEDEDRPAEGVVINGPYVATTEVTWRAFSPFLADPGAKAAIGENAQGWIARSIETLPVAEREKGAVGFISLNAALAYCDWLSATAKEKKLEQRYRLPTEDEWEYACAGGGDGRFCYGDEAKYAKYFAQCDGRPIPVHGVARKMPNMYGLYDLHGGLWERTDSRYPLELITDPAIRKMLDDPGSKIRDMWVYKGGAFHNPALRCRRAQRNYAEAESSNDYTGFRIVMEREP